MVRLSEYLNLSQICLELESKDKHGIINELAEYVREAKGIKNFKVFLKDVFKRESVATTGIGGEVAIPHARTDAVDSFVIAFGRSTQGVNFEALDSQPCKLFFRKPNNWLALGRTRSESVAFPNCAGNWSAASISTSPSLEIVALA